MNMSEKEIIKVSKDKELSFEIVEAVAREADNKKDFDQAIMALVELGSPLDRNRNKTK